MPTATEVFLPATLPFPIKVHRIISPTSSNVSRHTPLLEYAYVWQSRDGGQPETRYATWESSVEGTIDKWNVRIGQHVGPQFGPVVLINEPCLHQVQFHGLCSDCGKDMTEMDFLDFAPPEPATVEITNMPNGPTVTAKEAKRLHKEDVTRLLNSRKLLLIVDLDQTIVHAAVDPTIGEWIAEGEAWETEDPEKRGEVNPNWPALKDVKRFKLGAEMPGGRRLRARALKGKGKVEDGAPEEGAPEDKVWYYVKPRPGLVEFLKEVSAKYEMHVYTAGTRAYADKVCAAIDPDGIVFGNRIMSRDESLNQHFKFLQRLFPVDDNMVVIIDDRGDVWKWCPNLVKVEPYVFYVGIGDINSARPKQETLDAKSPPPSTTPERPKTPPLPSSPSDENNVGENVDTDVHLPSDHTAEAEDAAASELIEQQALELESQLDDRPLKKKQEELLEPDADAPSEEASSIPESNATGHEEHHPKRRALLTNDDTELERVKTILEEIHTRFYIMQEIFEENRALKGRGSLTSDLPDVKTIIPSRKQETFAGMHLLFTSVIPNNQDPATHEVWRIALEFGAKCYSTLSPQVTHVVAAKRGTAKVDAARRRGNIHIVWYEWFSESVRKWEAQDESRFYLEAPPSTITRQVEQPPVSRDSVSEDDDDDDDEDIDIGEEIGGLPETWSATDKSLWPATGDSTGQRIKLPSEYDAEVEEAMNESDDDESEETDTGDVKGENDMVSAPTTPRLRGTKRIRDITPSSNRSISGSQGQPDDSEGTKTPLAKRKKLSAEGSPLVAQVVLPGDEAANGSEEDNEEEEEEEEDFLAEQLGEEWG